MNILIANMSSIPVYAYGGTERVIWDLAKELVKLGHQITFLVPKGSHCDFAHVIEMDPLRSIAQQIPDEIDIAHLQFQPKDGKIACPYVVTEHGNAQLNELLDKNTIFVSKDHAKRHNSNAYVLNGLDSDILGTVASQGIQRKDLEKRSFFHGLKKQKRMWRDRFYAIQHLMK